MNEPAESTSQLEATIQLPAEATRTGSSLPPPKAGPAVALVSGSRPSLSSEANDLLRDRLRLAALFLCAGYAAFFVRNLFILERFDTTAHWVLVGCHAAMVAITGMLGWRLCTNCPHMLRHLRMAEWLIFGGSGVLFATMTFVTLRDSLEKGHILVNTGPWALLIFTHAMFIPNTWQRAAAAIVPAALTPVVVVGFFQWTSEQFAEVVRADNDFRGMLLSTGMSMTLCAAVAIGGVQTIRSLRRLAYEARQMGQYQLKKLLGKGGMGEVYLAEHLMLKRPCAIKLIRPDRAVDPNTLARFEREVRSTAKLSHWNTVEVFDYGRADDGTFYYVMEYLPGMNLDQLVRMHGPLPAERVVYLLAQVCEALAEAHDQGLIHRDIKPANIFSARRGGLYDVAKLLDFGLVRSSSPSSDVMLTQEGLVTGSPLFMSPEQALGDTPEERSDIYSLGAVAYFLLTGQPPFVDDNPLKVVMSHVRDRPAPPREYAPHLPADLEQIVMRCLEKEPADRFPDVLSLRYALQDCDSAGKWTREMAREWWTCHGCPVKKRLDAEVLELSACT